MSGAEMTVFLGGEFMVTLWGAYNSSRILVNQRWCPQF